MGNINTGNQDLQQKPQNEKKEKSNILLTLLAILLLLILIGLIIYIFYTFNKDTEKYESAESTNVTTSTLPDETANTDNEESAYPYQGWETYQNEIYGFRFKYPSDWEIIGEEGIPWIAPAIAGESNCGFYVYVAKDNWKFSIAYRPYLDDIAIGELDYDYELEVQGTKVIRAAQMVYEVENMTATDEIKYFSLMSPETYESTKDLETPRGFYTNNVLFSICYLNTGEATLKYEEWEDMLTTFDLMSESLEVSI